MIAFISDVHGNLPALRAVLDRLDEIGVDELVCLGDTAGYYCFVDECVDVLRERAVLTLRGNHDDYLVTGRLSGRSQTADACIAYQRSRVSRPSIEWLASHQPSGQYAGWRLAHGGWIDPLDEYVRDPTLDYFWGFDGDRFASGHTHLPLVLRDGALVYVNPGSVGQPRDGDPRASFAVVDGDRVELHRVEYDVGETQRAMAATGLPAYVAESLSYGLPIGSRP